MIVLMIMMTMMTREKTLFFLLFYLSFYPYRWLAETKFQSCVFIHNYPRKIKAFYMRDNIGLCDVYSNFFYCDENDDMMRIMMVFWKIVLMMMMTFL